MNTTEELIQEIKLGRPVIILDDEKRENEGDILIAAEKATEQMITFFARKACGLICLTLTEERCKNLNLPPMYSTNESNFHTPFTVSIEAARDVTTGISAHDRLITIHTAINDAATSEDLVRPGHIFPLRAEPAGVLTRAGHTEAGCDLTRLAGLKSAAVTCEIMNEDGSVARRPQLEEFAREHNLKIGTITDLIWYRIQKEKSVIRIKQCSLKTTFGLFSFTLYKDLITQRTHATLGLGAIQPNQPIYTNIYPNNALYETLTLAESSTQKTLKKIAETGSGMLIILDSGTSISDNLNQILTGPITEETSLEDLSIETMQKIASCSWILKDLGATQLQFVGEPLYKSALKKLGWELVESATYSCTI